MFLEKSARFYDFIDTVFILLNNLLWILLYSGTILDYPSRELERTGRVRQMFKTDFQLTDR